MLVDTDGILGMHNLNVTGEEEKAIHSFQLWAKSYPRDFHPLANVSIPYSIIGQYEKAEEATRKALRLRPDAVGLYENLVGIYISLNRFQEAQNVAKQALERKFDDAYLHLNLYALAFLQGDSAGMAQQAGWFQAKAEVENEILGVQSSTTRCVPKVRLSSLS
jgi:tetratricopeptide (TPR) repeat protein